MTAFTIQGMMCPHCQARVEKAIKAVAGVKQVDIDLATGIAKVEGDIVPTDVLAAVAALGYTAALA